MVNNDKHVVTNFLNDKPMVTNYINDKHRPMVRPYEFTNVQLMKAKWPKRFENAYISSIFILKPIYVLRFQRF